MVRSYICNYYAGDLPNTINVQSMISTYLDFGTVSESESASIKAILNANNFTTLGCVAEINGVSYLEINSRYICSTSFVTGRQYEAFLMGRSIDDRVERFRYYGKKFSKLRPCLPLNIFSDDQDTETSGEHKERLHEAFSKPWSVTVHPYKPIWKEATFPIYGFIHYVHYLQPCAEVPLLCHDYANNSTNTCNFCI